MLFNAARWRDFVDAVKNHADVTHAFIITDSDAVYQQVVSELPSQIESTQLYGDYLHTFQINVEVSS